MNKAIPHLFFKFTVSAILSLLIAGRSVGMTKKNDAYPKTGLEISRAVIILPDSPNAVEKWAAQEMREYLGKINNQSTPAVFAESKYQPTPKDFPIYIGKTRPGKEILANIEKKLGSDEFIMRGGIQDGKLVIVGHDTPYLPNAKYHKYKERQSQIPGIGTRSSLGTCRGVWYALHHYGTVRWYLPGKNGEVVPQSKYLALPETIDLRIKPDFEIRSIGGWIGRGSGKEFDKWHFRVGFGMGGRRIGSNHFLMKIPDYIYEKDLDKTMIALEGKGRTKDNAGICHNHPDIVQVLLARGTRWYKENNLTQETLAIMPIDGYNAKTICRCPRCAADRKKGLEILEYEEKNNVPFHSRKNTSHYVWPLVIKVAEAAKEKYPDMYVTCCAYSSYGMPPEKPEKFPENVGVHFCKERLLYMDTNQKRQDRERLAKWADKVSVMAIWEYYCWHMWANPIPLVCPREIAEDIKFLKGKVLGEIIEIHSNLERPCLNGGQWGMDGLNIYVTARYLLNADQNIDQLLDEYYRLFFGPAAATMKTFYQDLEMNWAKNPEKQRNADKYPLAFAELCMKRLATAKSQVPADSDYAKRIDTMINDFMPWVTLLRRKTNPPKYICPAITKGPVVNAKTADPAWRNAPAISGFMLTRGHPEYGGYPDDLKSKIKLVCDKSNLYILADIGSDWNNPLIRKAANPQWKEEMLTTIFAAPDGKRYVASVNAKGKAKLSMYPKNSSNPRKLDIRPVVKQQRTPGKWTIELAIPLKAIGLSNKPQGWKFNTIITSSKVWPKTELYKSLANWKRYGRNAYIIALQPEVKGTYAYDPKYYGKLIFKTTK